MTKKYMLIAYAAALLAGCASTSGNRSQPFNVDSLPRDADRTRLHTQQTLNASGLYLRVDGKVVPIKDWVEPNADDWNGGNDKNNLPVKAARPTIRVDAPVKLEVKDEDKP